MGKKLTLNISEELVEFAHEYAKDTHQSISKVVENFFSELKGVDVSAGLPAKTKELYGALEKIDMPSKKDMREIFHEKSIG